MMRNASRFLAGLSGLAAIWWPTVASAHVGVGATSGFAHGFAHPVSGLDHVLAMVTVGVFAFQLRGRAMWLVPAAFVGAMALGGLAGVTGLALPFVELGIALSVIVLGAAVALNVRAPLAVAAALVGFFAVFHGYAHGAEMPENAGGLAYGLGFVLATAALHASGIGAGFLVGRAGGRNALLVRSAGAIVSLLGVGILGGAI